MGVVADKIDTKKALHILASLIEENRLTDLRAGMLQDDFDLDRRTLRRYLDYFVVAEIATVVTKGVTKVYSLTIKLPKNTREGLTKEQSKAARAIEARALQEKLRYTQSPNEPNWVILPKFYTDLKVYPDVVKEEDIFNPETNYDYLAGICAKCKGTFTADDFDKTVWHCRKCTKEWLGDDVFRQDSEDVEI